MHLTCLQKSLFLSWELTNRNFYCPNYDIREIVTKDCVEIWQRATIRDALPEEYKDKVLKS
jgi:hypothetical protein